jgi:hypothetical protein
LICRVLFYIECASLESFRPTVVGGASGCLLSSHRQEHAVVLLALKTHMHMTCSLGCPTVSSEVAKLLLLLDPLDSCSVLLQLDHFLVAAGRHDAVRFFAAEPSSPLCAMLQLPQTVDQGLSELFPNWAASLSLSLWLEQVQSSGGDSTHSNSIKSTASVAMQRALTRWPVLLPALLSSAGIDHTGGSWGDVVGHPFFAHFGPTDDAGDCPWAVFQHISYAYASRNASLWRRGEGELHNWLFRNVLAVIAAVGADNVNLVATVRLLKYTCD